MKIRLSISWVHRRGGVFTPDFTASAAGLLRECQAAAEACQHSCRADLSCQLVASRLRLDLFPISAF
jgi:hypothetical protein